MKLFFQPLPMGGHPQKTLGNETVGKDKELDIPPRKIWDDIEHEVHLKGLTEVDVSKG